MNIKYHFRVLIWNIVCLKCFVSHYNIRHGFRTITNQTKKRMVFSFCNFCLHWWTWPSRRRVEVDVAIALKFKRMCILKSYLFFLWYMQLYNCVFILEWTSLFTFLRIPFNIGWLCKIVKKFCAFLALFLLNHKYLNPHTAG